MAVLQSQTTLLHIAEKTDLGSRVTPEMLAEFFFFFPLNTDTPKPESAYFLLVLSPKPLTLRGALPHYLSLKKELAYSSS